MSDRLDCGRLAGFRIYPKLMDCSWFHWGGYRQRANSHLSASPSHSLTSHPATGLNALVFGILGPLNFEIVP